MANKQGRLPDLVLVGAMRSGSSTLFRALADHDEVYMAPTKELHFFDYHYDLGLEWYRQQFSAAGASTVCGEATPTYLADRVAMQRLSADLPDARVMAILRDPVDRAYSHYWMRRARDRETRCWEDVVAQDLDEQRMGSVFWHSRYLAHFDNLFGLLDRDRCLILALDAFQSSPHDTFGRVCRFLGVSDGQPPSPEKPVNVYFRIRSQRLRKVETATRVPRQLRDAIGRLNHVEEPYPDMAADIRARLDASFRPDREAACAAAARPLRGPGP